MTVRVLLVDDQPLLRLGFRMVLESEADLEVVGEASDGAQAASMTAALAPDVVLMDVRMPVVDGIEATRRIVAAGAASRVLVLTTFDLDEYVYAALRAGASGFLLKDVPPAELVSGIRAVAAGDAVVAPAVTRRLIDAFAEHLPDPATGRSPTDKRLDRLTARERRGAGRGRPRAVEQRDRPGARAVGGDGEVARREDPDEARISATGSRSWCGPTRPGVVRPGTG
jgi:DNA-binding NarL/FixJ family response regulator